jgi:hypothetical protein
MVEAMFGEIDPRGKLPVTVTAPGSSRMLYPFGAGIGFAPAG